MFCAFLLTLFSPDSLLLISTDPYSINRMAEELEANVMLSSDFITSVSHELKTPISSISANCILLQDPSMGTKERQELISHILKEIQNLSLLISNILKLNKLEHQTIQPKGKRYNLSSQLTDCLLDFEDEWEKKNIEIELIGDDKIFITADEELLSLVWHNLISNAVKFTEDNGKISLSVEKNKNEISVSVKDTGCGISQKTGKHIFDKFYQGDTSHKMEGNGLGLSLVKRVIDILDARISVSSTLGEGTTFTVTISNTEES